ncbi:MAG: hypothetical protein ACK56I_34435, partial [bacterium]
MPVRIRLRASVCSRSTKHQVENGIFASVDVTACQQLFHGIGTSSDFENTSSNILCAYGRTRISVDHHKVRSSVNIADRQSAVMHVGIQPK